MARPWFQRGYRRMLVDMHIPDWDPAFLSKYDPAEMVRLYEAAGLSSAMFYTQSHVGLCYWPTTTGRMHAGLRGRDIVAETLALLEQAGIDACGYYSVVYNNWAYLEHPDWRMVPATEGSGGRYGHCCPNHAGYRDFARAQIEELVGRYRFDGLFIDMTFWPQVCVCEHCRARYRDEAAAEVPQMIDWCDPAWRRFQAAHVPFGVITRRQLPELEHYAVVVLPNVLRMDAEETEAFREYVRGGGRLYANRFTSLTETCGRRHDDFMLADVFGCHIEADDAGYVTYVRPDDAVLAQAIAPQTYLSCLRPGPAVRRTGVLAGRRAG